MKRVRKIIGWLIILVVLAVGALIAFVLFGVGGTVKTAVNTFGPKLLGAPVTLQDVEFSPLAGRLTLRGLHVGNPPGYESKSLFDATTILIEVDTLSLFGSTIHVRKIYAEKPSFTYEHGKDGNNIRDLLKNLGGMPKASTNEADQVVPSGRPGETPETKPPPPAPTNAAVIAAKKGPKFIVDEIFVDHPKLAATMTGADGRHIGITLGEIKIRDIGKAQGGVTLDEVMKSIVADFANRIEQATAGVTTSLKNTAKELKKSAAPLLESIKNLFGGKKDKKKSDPPPP